MNSKHDVLYPGLPWNENFDIMLEQFSKHVKANIKDVSLGVTTGGMLSVKFSNNVSEAGEKILEHLRVFTLAESLGGVESLAELPAKMTHAGIPEAVREELGINQNLVRFSVGVEDYRDLENDVRAAAEAVYAK